MKKTLFFLFLFFFLIHPSQKIKDATSMVNPIGSVLVGYWHNLKQGYYTLKITFDNNSNQSINFYKK